MQSLWQVLVLPQDVLHVGRAPVTSTGKHLGGSLIQSYQQTLTLVMNESAKPQIT